MNNFLTFHAEATPDGVNIMHRSNDGMTERVETVSYIDAVNRLDAGDYDDKPDEGMSIHLAIADGGNQGYFDYTSQHNVIMWRWLIATVFMLEMREENGTVSIIDDTGNPSEVAVYSNGIVAMPLVLLIAGTTSGSAASTGYSVSVGICSLIFVLICLYTPGRVREVVKPAKSQAKLPISAQIKAFCRNPNAVIVSFLFFANGICNYGRSAILAYYAQYVCNDMSVVSVFSAIVLISTFAGSIFSTILHKATKDKQLSCIICYTVCAVSSAPLFFLRPTNVTYWILTFFSVTTIIAGSTLSFSMFGDVSDYGEYRFHIRSDGFVSAISSMLMKAGSALGPAVILLVLKNVGFIANASVQNATVNHVLNFGVSFLVTIATGACAVLMLFYNLSDKRIAEVRKDLVPSKQF